ncbi:MAG TPA: zf-TFIIB domain-containing protein, partial [Bacteroidota bacterium]|nr:zf-TFIIB domain-containing protein [Bacteroidota bacterium]
MQCPSCDKGLTVRLLGLNSVESCDSCNGYWIETGELPNVLEHWLSSVKPAPGHLRGGNTPRTGYCTRCNVAIKSIQLEKSGPSLLVCSSCNGIWIEEK